MLKCIILINKFFYSLYVLKFLLFFSRLRPPLITNATHKLRNDGINKQILHIDFEKPCIARINVFLIIYLNLM